MVVRSQLATPAVEDAKLLCLKDVQKKATIIIRRFGARTGQNSLTYQLGNWCDATVKVTSKNDMGTIRKRREKFTELRPKGASLLKDMLQLLIVTEPQGMLICTYQVNVLMTMEASNLQ